HLVEAGAVAVGPVLAEAGDAGIDEAGVERLQALVIDAETEFHVRAIVFHENVRLLDELLQDRDTLGVLEIEGDAALVAVDVLEVGAVALPTQAPIALRRLDLDHVRPPIGELA